MPKGRENVYVCRKCGGHTVTIDRDEGTTPFMITCRAGDIITEDGLRIPGSCNGDAHSSFYPPGPRPPHIEPPKWEWYKPDGLEIRDITELNTLQHIALGGLLIRPIVSL